VQSWQLFLSLIFDIGNKKVLRIDYAAFMVFVCNMLLQLNNLENSSVTRKKGSYSANLKHYFLELAHGMSGVSRHNV